jgi:hypothetical protein
MWFLSAGGSGTLKRCIKVINAACYKRKHSRLNMRISRHVALINRESSCRLNSGRDVYKRQRIGGGLADYSIIS